MREWEESTDRPVVQCSVQLNIFIFTSVQGVPKKRLQDFMFTFYILEDIIFTLDHQKSLQIEEESGGNNLLFTKLIYLQNWSVQKGANFSIF